MNRNVRLPVGRLTALHLRLDWVALVFAVLLVGASLVTGWMLEFGVEVGEHVEPDETFAGGSAGETALGAGMLAVFEVIVFLVALGLALVARRIPQWVKLSVVGVAGGSAWMWLLWEGYVSPAHTLTVVAVATVVYVIDQHAGLWWIVNNVLAFVAIVIMAPIGGFIFGIWFLAALLVLLSVYDHVFATERDHMFTVAAWLWRLRVPILVVVPRTWRFAWGHLDDDTITLGIGMADLLLPAMFVGAIVQYGSGPVVWGLPLAAWGVLGGLVLAACRMSWALDVRGSGAGLPAITSGALGGFAVASAVGVLV